MPESAQLMDHGTFEVTISQEDPDKQTPRVEHEVRMFGGGFEEFGATVIRSNSRIIFYS
jgi:hypothetical protein